MEITPSLNGAAGLLPIGFILIIVVGAGVCVLVLRTGLRPGENVGFEFQFGSLKLAVRKSFTDCGLKPPTTVGEQHQEIEECRKVEGQSVENATSRGKHTADCPLHRTEVDPRSLSKSI